MDWIRNNLTRAIVIAVFVLLIAGALTLRSCHSAGTAKTETKLATGQAGAAIQSGADSVSTTSNVQAAADDRQQTVKEGTDAIDQRPGGDSNDAAERASCRLRSYRHSSRCIALLGPVAP